MIGVIDFYVDLNQELAA